MMTGGRISKNTASFRNTQRVTHHCCCSCLLGLCSIILLLCYDTSTVRGVLAMTYPSRALRLSSKAAAAAYYEAFTNTVRIESCRRPATAAAPGKRRDASRLAGGTAGAARGVSMKANNKNKRKREKRQGVGGGGEGGDAAGPAPQRVTKDAPVSVRAQIKYAKMRKSIRGAHPSAGIHGKGTRSYRRVKSTDYEDVVEPEDLSHVYMPDIAPALMVDGYNILFAWSKCSFMAAHGDLEGARRLLVEELDTLSAMRGWSVTVVFDAYNRKDSGRRSYKTPNKIDVIFTGEGESADMFVERHTMELKDAGCPNVMVATGDKLMQSLVVGAGAEVFSPDRIIEEIAISHREAAEYTDRYIRRKEALTAESDMRDMLESIRYVANKGKPKGRGRGNDAGEGGAEAGGAPSTSKTIYSTL